VYTVLVIYNNMDNHLTGPQDQKPSIKNIQMI